MRRLMATILSIGFFCLWTFFFVASAVSAEKPVPATKAPGTKAPAAPRVTKMRAAGIVTEISDSTLKIERKVMDKVETMEFVLEKPVPKIKAGDKVKVSYITKDDKNIASKVIEDIPQKTVKKVKKAEGKAATPGLVAPASK